MPLTWGRVRAGGRRQGRLGRSCRRPRRAGGNGSAKTGWRGVAVSPPGRRGIRRETEPAGEIGARVGKPRPPAWWLSAVVRDLRADRVIAGAALRIRRGGIFLLDLVAAERSDLQLVFAGFRLPGQRPLSPERRGDVRRKPGRLPGAAVDRHFDPAHSPSWGPGDAGGDGRPGGDGRAIGGHVDPRSRFDGAGDPGPAARVPVIGGVRPRGQLDRGQAFRASVGAPDPRRQQSRGEAVSYRQRLIVHAQRDQRGRPLPDHLEGESRREARN